MDRIGGFFFLLFSLFFPVIYRSFCFSGLIWLHISIFSTSNFLHFPAWFGCKKSFESCTYGKEKQLILLGAFPYMNLVAKNLLNRGSGTMLFWCTEYWPRHPSCNVRYFIMLLALNHFRSTGYDLTIFFIMFLLITEISLHSDFWHSNRSHFYIVNHLLSTKMQNPFIPPWRKTYIPTGDTMEAPTILYYFPQNVSRENVGL